jgi:hypothetical protein
MGAAATTLQDGTGIPGDSAAAQTGWKQWRTATGALRALARVSEQQASWAAGGHRPAQPAPQPQGMTRSWVSPTTQHAVPKSGPSRPGQLPCAGATGGAQHMPPCTRRSSPSRKGASSRSPQRVRPSAAAFPAASAASGRGPAGSPSRNSPGMALPGAAFTTITLRADGARAQASGQRSAANT